MRSGLVY